MPHSDARKAFGSRFTDSACRSEFKAGGGFALVGVRKAPQKAPGRRPACRFARDMGRWAPTFDRQVGQQRRRHPDDASSVRKDAFSARLHSRQRSERTPRGRSEDASVCTVDRMNSVISRRSTRAQGAQESLWSRLLDFASRVQFNARPQIGSVDRAKARLESLWSRPPYRFAREMPRPATEAARKVIGRWMANFASDAEFDVLPLIASVACPDGVAKVVRRWPVCRLARELPRHRQLQQPRRSANE
jgi:hypothetical protein